MNVYILKNTIPYVNLATEQYFMDRFDGEDIFMLWQNDSSVIIGKNQNAYAEVNRQFAEEKEIKVARRLTGGGAVFHDLGNVNFSFITKASEETTLNYESFCVPIIGALSKLGIEASLSGRNDILANGLKVSGNAQCRYNGCILHHGTLLWSADFSYMQGVLNPDPEKLKAKGIKSVSSRVGNLRDMLPEGKNGALTKNSTALDFIAYLEACIPGNKKELTDKETEEIKRLSEEKFATWEWNWGKSPEFSTVRKKRFTYGSVEISLNADKGIIRSIKIAGDFFGAKDVSGLEDTLVGISLEAEKLRKALCSVSAYISGAEADDIISIITE